MKATDDAYDHYYAVNGAKPILRAVDGDKWVDVVSGHFVTESQVKQGGSYGGAFRYKAANLRNVADQATFMPLRVFMLRVADQLEEVADRMEVKENGQKDKLVFGEY